MERASTNHSLLNTGHNDVNDELDELLTLLKDKKKDFQDAMNYLDSLMKDVSDETVHKVMKFAKQYCMQVKDKENTGIK